MPQLKSLAKRQADQKKARERLAELARKFVAKPVGGKQHSLHTEAAPPAPSKPSAPTRPQRPWAQFVPEALP